MTNEFGFEFAPSEVYEDHLEELLDRLELQETGAYKPPLPRLGMGQSTLEVISPRPDIGDLVDYLDASVLARGRVIVPTQRITFLVKLNPPKELTWWNRLWDDPLKHFPTVRVTIELIQVGPSLTPISTYGNQPIVKKALNEYVIRLHTKTPPCSTDYVPVIGSAFALAAEMSVEKELGIGGHLDTLLKQGKITSPVSAKDEQRHFWFVYATFPAEIGRYVIPRDRVVLDEFEFDKSSLTKVHLAKITAIARYIAALAAFVGNPPKVEITGHTDIRGTEKYNMELGYRRAAAVNEALHKAIDAISPGLSKRMTITPRSFGETKPLIMANTEAEHARNRRVEVLVQKPLPYCPRVSLQAVVNRALKLMPRLAQPEERQRLSCLLHKVLLKGTDDRWIDPQGVLNVYNQDSRFGTYPLILVRDFLSGYTHSLTDAELLASLQRMDKQIIEGIGQVNHFIQVLSGAASSGIPLLAKMKAMDTLRAWTYARVKYPKSIYSCYREV
jgi:hypothetical protein